MNEIRASTKLTMIFLWNFQRLHLPNGFLHSCDSSCEFFKWYRSSLVIQIGRVTSKSLKLHLVGGQVAVHDSLKSIFHAGYSHLSPFIGDYLSGFRKEDRHNALERIEITRHCRRQKSVLSSFILFFSVTRISSKRRSNRTCLHVVSF